MKIPLVEHGRNITKDARIGAIAESSEKTKNPSQEAEGLCSLLLLSHHSFRCSSWLCNDSDISLRD